jgi:hypothetical protein
MVDLEKPSPNLEPEESSSGHSTGSSETSH